MASTKGKTSIRAATGALLIVIATVTWVASRGPSRTVTLPNGYAVKLEGWNFKATPVRYDLPDHPWARRLEKFLPNPVKQRIASFKPVITAFATPNFPGEPVLSAAFSIRAASAGASDFGALRVSVSDDHGQEFDPAVHSVISQDGYWATEIRAFPRRGSELRLRLMSNNNPLCEIKIPNPAHGPHPQWTPSALPVSASDDELEFNLVKFRSYQSGAAVFTKDGVYPRTQCAFQVREKGRDSTAWRPVAFEISDATGNHWRPWPDSRLDGMDGMAVLAGFLGALWPDEGAWKLRVEFRRAADFPDHELLRIDHLPIPGAEEILQPQTAYEANGATIEVAAVIGARVPWERIARLNARRTRDCITVLITGRILSQGRRVSFGEAKDENGSLVRLEGAAYEPGQVPGQNPDLLPYSFNFKAPPAARELTLTLAVSRSRFIEFLAKPEQVREDSSVPRN